MADKSQPTIKKRYCKRFVPSAPSAGLSEFLKDRYRNLTRPEGPFCHCGLLAHEHANEAIANASSEVLGKEKCCTQEAPRFKAKKCCRTHEESGANISEVKTHACEEGDGAASHELCWSVEKDTTVVPTDVHYRCPLGHESSQEQKDGQNTSPDFDKGHDQSSCSHIKEATKVLFLMNLFIDTHLQSCHILPKL